MSSTPSIVSFLTRRGEPVYGTSLAPDDFPPLVGGDGRGWSVRARTSAGEDAQYTIRLVGDGRAASCDVRVGGGPPRPLRNPFLCTIGGTAPVQDWYDAICMEDAAWGIAQRHERRWGGTGLGDVMTRVEHGVSAYEQHEVAVSTFLSLPNLQEWIDAALAGTTVRVEALVLSDFPYVRGEQRDGQLLQSVVDGEVIGYLPVVVATNLCSQGWLTPSGEQGGPRPRVELRLSGRELLTLHAGAVQSWSGVGRAGTLRGGDVPVPDPGGWVLLGVQGTDLAIPLPWGSAHLLIDTDDDGAMVAISVLPSEGREAHHRRRAAFERRWGRWLDDDAVLDDEELSEGVARAEQALRAVLSAEES